MVATCEAVSLPASTSCSPSSTRTAPLERSLVSGSEKATFIDASPSRKRQCRLVAEQPRRQPISTAAARDLGQHRDPREFHQITGTADALVHEFDAEHGGGRQHKPEHDRHQYVGCDLGASRLGGCDARIEDGNITLVQLA